MSYLDSNGPVVAAADTGTTVAAIAFWVAVVAIYLALILITLRSIIRTPLSTRSRTLWVWLVVLAPLLGIILWYASGRPAARRGPSTGRA